MSLINLGDGVKQLGGYTGLYNTNGGTKFSELLFEYTGQTNATANASVDATASNAETYCSWIVPPGFEEIVSAGAWVLNTTFTGTADFEVEVDIIPNGGTPGTTSIYNRTIEFSSSNENGWLDLSGCFDGASEGDFVKVKIKNDANGSTLDPCTGGVIYKSSSSNLSLPIVPRQSTSTSANLGWYQNILGGSGVAQYGFSLPSDFGGVVSATVRARKSGGVATTCTMTLDSAYCLTGELEYENTETDSSFSHDFPNTTDEHDLDVTSVLTGLTSSFANGHVGLSVSVTQAGTVFQFMRGTLNYISTQSKKVKTANLFWADQIGASTVKRPSDNVLGAAIGYHNLEVPSNFSSVTKASIWVRKGSSGSGEKPFNFESKHGLSGEAQDENTLTYQIDHTVDTGLRLYLLNLTSDLSGIPAGSRIGTKFTNGSGVNCYILGGHVEGT